jgi:hypothetical protein
MSRSSKKTTPITGTPAASVSKSKTQPTDLDGSDVVFQTVDLTDVQPAKDPIAQRNAEEAALIKAALLGYAKVDVRRIEATFGRFNPRALNKEELNKLVRSMKGEGMHRYAENNIIFIAVRKGVVDATKLSRKRPDGGDNLPMLAVMDPKGTASVDVLGGRHRINAVVAVAEEIEKEVGLLQAEYDKKRHDAETHPGTITAAELEAMKERLETKKGELKGAGLWGVAVFDLGECDA